MDKTTTLKKEVSKLNIQLSDLQTSQFLKYYDMLIEKNKVMNLTAITEFEDVLVKHFIDSLSLTKVYDISKKINLLDLGTGAGFPGIPIKIAYPDINIVLMDSLNKRVNFLNEVITELGLKGIQAIHGRAEECGINTEYREKFDVCVSRAVAKLSSLSEYCLPFVKVGGSFIAYKAGNITSELEESKNSISLLGGKFSKEISFTLPETDINRTLVVIEKRVNTPKKYPRQAGKPSKEPL